MNSTPWVPFPDYLNHLSITLPVTTLSPAREADKAKTAQIQAFSMLIDLGDPKISYQDKIKIAFNLAKLSAKIMVRREIIQSILDEHPPIPEEAIVSLEESVTRYWMVAKSANLLVEMPRFQNCLMWVISQVRKINPKTPEGRLFVPWRSPRLADAMIKKYGTREAFFLKIWDSNLPSWLRVTTLAYGRPPAKMPSDPA